MPLGGIDACKRALRVTRAQFQRGVACNMEFEEEHDLGLIRRYAYRCRGRSLNDENLVTYYSSLLPNLHKKGRRSNDTAETVNKHQGLVQKVKDHGDRLSTMLASRRRLKEKKSVEGSAPAVFFNEEITPIAKWPSELVARTIKYQYSTKPKYSVPARRYSGMDGAQSMLRRLQKHAVDQHTLDLDIQNCAFHILHQIIEKTQPKPPLPKDLASMFDEATTNRSAFLARLNVDATEGKKIMNTVLNGGAPPENLRKNEA